MFIQKPYPKLWKPDAGLKPSKIYADGLVGLYSFNEREGDFRNLANGLGDGKRGASTLSVPTEFGMGVQHNRGEGTTIHFPGTVYGAPFTALWRGIFKDVAGAPGSHYWAGEWSHLYVGGQNAAWGFYVTSDGTFGFRCSNNTITAPVPIPLEQPITLVGAYSGSLIHFGVGINNELTYYSAFPASGSWSTHQSYTLRLGGHWGGDGSNGTRDVITDTFALWQRELSMHEIFDLTTDARRVFDLERPRTYFLPVVSDEGPAEPNEPPTSFSKKRIYNGLQEFVSGEKEHTIDLVGLFGEAVDPSKTIVLIDTYSASGNRHNAHHMVSLTEDGETLTISRAGESTNPTGASEVAFKIIEFSSGVNVRRVSGGGSGSINSAKPLGFSVDRDRTFALFSYKLNITGNSTETSSIGFFLPADDEYQLDCRSTTIAPYVTYEAQIVEFDAGLDCWVEYVGTTSTGGMETLVELSKVAHPSRTSLFGTACRGPQTAASNNRSVAADLIDNGATLRLRKAQAAEDTQYHVYVVRWPEGVQTHYTEVGNLGDSIATFDIGIPEVDWAKSIPFQQGGMPYFGNPGQGSHPPAQWIRTHPGEIGTNVSCRRAGGYTHFPPSIIQVISFGTIAEPTPTWPDDLMTGLSQMPENRWRCPVLTPGKSSNWTETTSDYRYSAAVGAIYNAWPCTILDTKREVMIGHGGGHANYSGNEIYECDIHTGLFNRVCLPTQVYNWNPSSGLNYYGSIFHEDDAPASAHCYSSSVYLEVNDVYVIHGGAAQGTGGRYRSFNAIDDLGDEAGPYVYDAKKRDPFKVGGATGSGLNPETEGLNAWFNAWDPSLLTTYRGVNTTAYATVEDGKDVLYWYGGGNSLYLYKTIINDPWDWSKNPQTIVGGDTGHTSLGKAAFVKSLGIFFNIRQNATTGLNAARAVDLNGAVNGKTTPYTITLNDPDDVLSGLVMAIEHFSLVWDEARDRIVGFCRGDMIEITHQNIMPDGLNDGDFVNQFTVRRIHTTFDPDYRPMDGARDSRPFGRWWYSRKYDCFLYTESTGTGASNTYTPYLWVYKPENWQPLGISRVDADLVLEWALHGNVAQSLSAAWDVRSWSAADLQNLWTILETVEGKVVADWALRELVGEDLEASWGLNETAAQGVELVWDVERLGKVAAAIELAWHLRQLEQSDLEGRWHLNELAGNDLTTTWSIQEQLDALIRLGWNIENLGKVSAALELLWSMRERVGAPAELVWDLRNSRSSAVQYLWDLREQVGADQDLGWVLNQITERQLDTLWNIARSAERDLSAEWDVRAAAGESLEIEWHQIERITHDGVFRWNVGIVYVASNRDGIEVRGEVRGIIIDAG